MILGDFLARVIVGGLVGMLLENLFTGIHSVVFLKDRNAMCKTSLWSIPIYGLGCYILTALRHLCKHPALFIPVGTIAVFAMEYVWGWTLRKFKVKAWDYTGARFSIHGLIRMDYVVFWLLVTVAFDRLTDFVSKAFELVGRMA